MKIDKSLVSNWLNEYIQAWKSYDREAIGGLFSENAVYYPTPYSRPIEGREAIVSAWLGEPDEPGTFDPEYQPVAVDGDTAVATGITRYLEKDGTTPKAEYSNVFLLRFDDDGRCREYREWFVKKPEDRNR